MPSIADSLQGDKASSRPVIAPPQALVVRVTFVVHLSAMTLLEAVKASPEIVCATCPHLFLVFASVAFAHLESGSR